MYKRLVMFMLALLAMTGQVFAQGGGDWKGHRLHG